MRIIAILSWFNERPSWLAGSVASLAKVGVSHCVAVDGAYLLYPEGRGFSAPEQHAAIVETCRALDIGLTLHVPQEPWIGNEVEKRTAAIRLAEAFAEPNVDWYYMHDADHFVLSAMGHQQALKETECDVAECRFAEDYGSLHCNAPIRVFFRAIPGLIYDGNHYTPRTPDGRDLHHGCEPALDLGFRMEVHHRTAERDPYRKESQQVYYRRRDELGAEIHHEEAVAA